MSAEHPTTIKEDEIRDRRSRVWQMRVDGQTVREIAADLDVSVGTIQSDLNAIRAELDEGIRYNAETDRAIGAARLDKVARKLIASIEVVEDAALPGIANAIARIEERRSKLLGLDAASKTELTGADGGPLKVEDAKNALLAKLSSLAASEPSKAEATGADSETES